MQTEHSLPVTQTHSGREAKGTLFGLEGKSVVPVLFAVILSVLLLALNFSVDAATLPFRVAGALLPTVVTTTYVVLFVHRKPPHYARDVFRTWGALALDAFIGCPHETLAINTRPSTRRPPEFPLDNISTQ